jgi:hypothetical protein
MAHLKRLTDVQGSKVFVNLEMIAYMQRNNDQTTIAFVGGKTDRGTMYVQVDP